VQITLHENKTWCQLHECVEVNSKISELVTKTVNIKIDARKRKQNGDGEK